MNNNLNYIAINQTLFKKTFIIGQGFIEGKQNYADTSLNGWYVFVNGKTIIPEYGDIKKLYTIGTMYCNNLITGMSTCGGQIQYYLGVTEDEFLVIVDLKLDEKTVGETDSTEEVAVFMFQNRLPSSEFIDGKIAIDKIAKELMFCHLTVFIGTDNPKEVLKEIKIDNNSTLLKIIIDEYIHNVELGKMKEKQISKEEDLINEMDNFFKNI